MYLNSVAISESVPVPNREKIRKEDGLLGGVFVFVIRQRGIMGYDYLKSNYTVDISILL